MTKRALGRWLRTQPSSEQIDRGWRAVHARMQRRPPTRAIVLGVLVAVMLAIAIALPAWRKTPGIAATIIETDATHTQTVTLAEGSTVVLGPSSRLLLVDVSTQHVRLEVQRGTIDVDATHREGRTFSVGARQVDVEVVGTQFHVGVGEAPRDVSVSVSRGRVRIVSRDDPSHPRFLSAGESWSTAVALPLPTTTAPPAPTLETHDAGPVHEAPPKPKLGKEFMSLYKDGRYVDAYGLVVGDFEEHTSTLGADELYELADTARQAGHPRHAAIAFDALRTRFRSDPHAPIAALELGRLDLDELDDPRAAKNALDDFISMQPDKTLREVAEARRVQALEAMGDRTECAAARQRYLDAYPDGAHRTTVARRCR